MSLGKKITLWVLLLGCCIGVGSYAAISWSIFPEFEEFERRAARESMDRLERVATAEVRGLAIMNGEYASWTDTYNFALGRHESYIEDNLSTAYWKTLGVDLVLIYDRDGKLVWGSYTNPDYGDATRFDEQLERPIDASHPLLEHGLLDDSVSGILSTKRGPMIIASDAILTTYGEGPGAGSFVIARYVDDSLMGDIATRSSANARFIELGDAAAGLLSPEQIAALVAAEDKRLVQRMDAEVVGYRLVRDVLGDPAGVLEVRMPQTITGIGREAINVAIMIIAGVTAVFLVVLVVLIRRLVIAPVTGLTSRMRHIRKTGDLESNSMQTQSDELGALAREFDELTTDLHLAQKELEATRDVAVEASHAKSEFLARMSHEIRTPMNGVLGMTELLKNTPMDLEQRRFADTIYASAENLLDIINDILDFSKIEAGKLQLDVHDIDLGAVIEETVDTLAPQAHQKGLELINDVAQAVHTPLRGDSMRLRQVLTNLIANAIKFTNRGEVVARASVLHQDDAAVTVRFAVVDTGIGIRAEKQKIIFDSFAQEDGSTTRLYGGTGLGLAISRQLVDLMGGKLQVESEPDVGSTFSFTLSLPRGDTAGECTMRTGGRVAGARILVVDDNATNRDILEQQLAGWRAHCDSAESADQAMTLLAASLESAGSYDLVILDMHMPQVDGIELARRIRTNEAYDEMKLMLLSSVAMPASEEAMRELGIAGQLTKPVRQSPLYDCLSVVLSGEALVSGYSMQVVATTQTLQGRVLLAEDNPVNQAVAMGMLASIGVEVNVVADGAAAVAALEASAYDLVLMDCQMPVMDGLAATRAIRDAEGAAPRTPIVALTANAMAGDREQCLEAGMDEYLGKPFTRDQLHAVLSLYLRRPDVGEAPAARSDRDENRTTAAAPAADDREGRVATPLDRGMLAVLAAQQQPRSPSLVKKVIAIYLDSAPELKDRLLASMANADAAEVGQCAHALKSSSTNVGATHLADICKRLERMARAGELAAAHAFRVDLEDEFRRVVEALQSELEAVVQ